MSILIDVDALIEALNNSDAQFDAEVNRIILDQPTAYELDKVVMDLENASYCKSTPTYDHPYTDSIIDLDEAIDIVKRGGIDD